MSYLDSLGSLVLPVSSIIPYARINGYSLPPPSGYLFCDGNYYDPSDPSYSNLFSVIKYNYGQVVKTVATNPTTYFRVPNLMGQEDFDYTDSTGITYYTPNKGIYSTTIGGINKTGVINNPSNQFYLSTDQMPSHTHTTKGQTAVLKPASGETYLDTGHTHTLTQATITVNTVDNGSHYHTITDPGHSHSTGTGTGQIPVQATIPFTYINSDDASTYCFLYTNSNDTKLLNDGYIANGQYTDANTIGITITESSTPTFSSSVKIDPAFSNQVDDAGFYGTTLVSDETSGSAGNQEGISLPITPSFIMNYLIKI